MSNFETFLIVMLCAVPIVALFMVFPKLKFNKKEKKVAEPTKTLAEIKAEEPKAEEVKPELERKPNNEISTGEFESYIDFKKKNTTLPKKVELPSDFKDMSMPYMPRRKQVEKKPQSVAEEIKSLSPELKAMLIAGVLDKRDY